MVGRGRGNTRRKHTDLGDEAREIGIKGDD